MTASTGVLDDNTAQIAMASASSPTHPPRSVSTASAGISVPGDRTICPARKAPRAACRATLSYAQTINMRLFTLLCLVAGSALAQNCEPGCLARSNAATIDADGTARITRVIELPATISPEARSLVGRQPGPAAKNLEENRARTDTFRKTRSEEARRLYPVNIEEQVIGGVRTDVITPLTIAGTKRDHVLVNVHGGGFVTDSGSLVEGIPIANLTGTKVVSVYYRLAPEHPFPAAVDDTVAVYKELLKTYKPEHIGLFGTSAGAILTAETAVRLRELGLPLPAALGVFSGLGDLGGWDDSRALFTLSGFGGPQPEKPHEPSAYVGKTDPKNHVLSPIYADLKGFPPTLFVTSTRDILLSGTTLLHRAFLRAGVPAELVVFEALPHAFWYDYRLPETKEALGIMAGFFDRSLGK
jgi:acetyl esterase/lipase